MHAHNNNNNSTTIQQATGGVLQGAPFTPQQRQRRRPRAAQQQQPRRVQPPVVATNHAETASERNSRYDSLLACGPQSGADFEALYREHELIEERRQCESAAGRRWRRAPLLERTLVRAISGGVRWFKRVGGLIGVTAAWFVLFFLCVGFWWLLFATGVIPQSITDNDGAKTAIGEMTLIVGIIYYVWLRETLYGYTKGAATYRAVLESISAYCRTLYQFLRARAAGATGESTAAGDEAYFVIQTLAIYSLRLFTVRDRELCASAASTLVEPLGAELAGEAPSGLPADVVDGLIAMLQLRIARLEGHQLTGSDTRVLEQQLTQLRAALVEARTAYYVSTPRVFRVHIFLVMVVYFLVWLPFIMYARIEQAALAVYPVFMFLLWGVFIDGWYLGDAFTASASWTGMHMARWRRDIMESNERAYLRWLRERSNDVDDDAEREARAAVACLYRTTLTSCAPLAEPTVEDAERRAAAPIGRNVGLGATDVVPGGRISRPPGGFIVI